MVLFEILHLEGKRQLLTQTIQALQVSLWLHNGRKGVKTPSRLTLVCHEHKESRNSDGADQSRQSEMSMGAVPTRHGIKTIQIK